MFRKAARNPKRKITLDFLNKGATNKAPTVTKKKKMDSKEKKIRPNVFMAVQIRNPDIHEQLAKCQNDAIKENKKLERHLESVNKAHITLCVANIQKEQIEEAKIVLAETFEKRVRTEFSEVSFGLTGVSGFSGGRVVFVKPSTGTEHLHKLREILQDSLMAAGFHVNEARKAFKPHVTIFKADFESTGKQGAREMKGSFVHFAEYEDFHFGSEKLTSVQFCCMESPKGEDGYYYKHDEYFFNYGDKNVINADDNVNKSKDGVQAHDG